MTQKRAGTYNFHDMFRDALKSRHFWGAALGVFLFLVMVMLPESSGLTPGAKKAGAVAALMACLWIGEVIPIYATALLPIVLFPLLGVLDTKAAAYPYGDRIVFLMMGGFMIAESMKKWGLHKRIALHTIRALGGSPSGLVLGFMAATAFLSMWMSNTATAVMMVPIAVSVIWRLQGAEGPADIEPDPMSTSLMLAIAYSASVGGIATLVGTPPNAILAGQAKVLFPEGPEIFFDRWMLLGLPVSLIMLAVIWLLLTKVLFRVKGFSAGADRGVIGEELSKLGPMSRGEKTVSVVFAITAFLWMTRRVWSGWLPEGSHVHDSTVAILAAVALFAIPVDWKGGEFALDWRSAVKIPWGVLILFGGGFSLAAGLQESGFAAWVGERLGGLSGAPPILAIAAVCLMMTFLTEVTMNTSTTTIMMPVMAMTGKALGINPYFLMVPAAVSASCAFMLPAATPPNAIVFGSGLVRLPRMAKTGILINLAGVIVVTLLVYFLAGPALGLDLGSFPAWAR